VEPQAGDGPRFFDAAELLRQDLIDCGAGARRGVVAHGQRQGQGGVVVPGQLIGRACCALPDLKRRSARLGEGNGLVGFEKQLGISRRVFCIVTTGRVPKGPMASRWRGSEIARK
jgi:hypothetical protein